MVLFAPTEGSKREYVNVTACDSAYDLNGLCTYIKQSTISSQHRGTHLHCLSVRYPTVNRNLRDCLSSCRSTAGSTASVTTTTTATTITAARRSGRSSSSSSSSVRGITTASSCGAGGGVGGPGGVACGGRGPRLALHGALCSSHL